MQNSEESPATLSLTKRLLIAVGLGLLLGITAFINPTSALLQWVQWVPIVGLVIVMLLSIVFDARVRHGNIPTFRIAYGCALTLLVVVVVYVVQGVIAGIIPLIGFFETLLILPVELGTGVAFTIGDEKMRLSSLSGLLAWAATSVMLLISVFIQASIPGNHISDLLGTIIPVIVIGLGFAALGGLLGRLFRAWIMKRVLGEEVV